MGMIFTTSYYSSLKVMVWTLFQKLVPVIAIAGIFFLFPASKEERFVSIYWLIFPLFSIYLYQTLWIFIDTVDVDTYFIEFTVWATIIISIFTLALFRRFLIERERAFEKKLERIQEVIQQLRDEEIIKLFSNLYNIDVATEHIMADDNASKFRDKINDYALDGMKNINRILKILDRQKEELNKIEHQSNPQTSFVL
jgi:hypothetical protein